MVRMPSPLRQPMVSMYCSLPRYQKGKGVGEDASGVIGQAAGNNSLDSETRLQRSSSRSRRSLFRNLLGYITPSMQQIVAP